MQQQTPLDFAPSPPYTCLMAAGLQQGKPLANLCDGLSLRARYFPAQGLTMIEALNREEGTHKRQALVLFVAAMELAFHKIADSLMVFEVSPLHLRLRLACFEANPKVDEDAPVFPSVPSSPGLRLCPAVQLHLAQAGFEVGPPVPQWRRIDERELMRCRDAFLNRLPVCAEAAC